MIKTDVGPDYFFYVQHLMKQEKPTAFSDALVFKFDKNLLNKCCLMPRYPEVYMNYVMDRFEPANILEIGTYFGVTTAYFAMRDHVKTVETIDIESFPQSDSVHNALPEECQHKITYNYVDNDQDKKDVIDNLGFDFCFIDGLHTYEGVKFDYECVKDVCDVVLFHDYATNKGITDFINEIGCEQQSIELSFALKVLK